VQGLNLRPLAVSYPVRGFRHGDRLFSPKLGVVGAQPRAQSKEGKLVNIAGLRDSISATRDIIYLNTGWAGPSPEAVVTRIQRVLDEERSAGPASLAGLRLSKEVREEAQSKVAELLNVDAEEILLTHGTTEGVHIVLYGFPWRPNDELVTCDLEHPAIATAAAVLAERRSVSVRRLEVPPDAAEADMAELFSGAIGPQTRMVALSHVQYSCGLRLPVRSIADAAHRVGALLLIDGAQTAGQIPLDLRQLGADFYAISGQKWLLGPEGTGALFIAHALSRSLEPLLITHSLADAWDRHVEPLGGGYPLRRFSAASQNTALVAGFAEAVSLLLGTGIKVIEARANDMADRLRSRLAAIPGCSITGPTAPDVSCGLVSVAVEGWPPPKLVDELWTQWRIAARAVGYPAAVRFSVAAFNTEAEIDMTIDALRSLAGERPAVI
jgi:selenocysteine lyase/cysteine desulfurase